MLLVALQLTIVGLAEGICLPLHTSFIKKSLGGYSSGLNRLAQIDSCKNPLCPFQQSASNDDAKICCYIRSVLQKTVFNYFEITIILPVRKCKINMN
jgi:hypothetical protein